MDSTPGIDMLRRYGYQWSVSDGVISCQVFGLRRKRHVGCDRTIRTFLSAQSVTTPKDSGGHKTKDDTPAFHQPNTESPCTVHEETIAAWYETAEDVDPRKRTIRTAV